MFRDIRCTNVGNDTCGCPVSRSVVGNKIVGGIGGIVAHLHGDAMGQRRFVGDRTTVTGSVTALKLNENLYE